MRKVWDGICKLGGLKSKINLYALRHSFASQLIANGCDMMTVSKLLGHTDIKTTYKHYGHLIPDKAQEALDKFAASVPFTHEGLSSAA